jgi:ABC-type uncharacterized transport system auxiliary subunit
MKNMRYALVGLMVALSAAAVSCGSHRPVRYYRIDVPAAPTITGTPFPVSLAVGSIESPPLMKDGRILYQVGSHEMGAYEYHRWVETPDRMVQNSLVSLLRSSGRYSAVELQRSSAKSDYLVVGKIHEFSEVDKPEIHTRVSMEIELRDIISGRTVWSRLYKREEPVQGKEVSNVVDSLDRNLKQGLAETVAALQQYFAQRERN